MKRNLIGIAIVAMPVFLFSAVAQAPSSSIMIQDSCSLSEKLDLLGSTPVQYKIEKGSIFTLGETKNGAPSYCGHASMHAPPFGWTDVDYCVATSDGRLISFPNSMHVVESDCRVADPGKFDTPYRDIDFAPWSGDGPATLHGQAFLKTVGGDVKTCAGSTVLLIPANPYGEEVVAKARAQIAANPDPRIKNQIRSTICDAQGNFAFESIPVNRWYVTTDVTWGIPQISAGAEQHSALMPLILGSHSSHGLGGRLLAHALLSLMFARPSSPTIDQQGGELLQALTTRAGDTRVLLTDRDME